MGTWSFRVASEDGELFSLDGKVRIRLGKVMEWGSKIRNN